MRQEHSESPQEPIIVLYKSDPLINQAINAIIMQTTTAHTHTIKDKSIVFSGASGNCGSLWLER